MSVIWPTISWKNSGGYKVFPDKGFSEPALVNREDDSTLNEHGIGRATKLRRLLFYRRRMVLRIFLHHRDHLFHAFLDLVDLRMHFLDEVMFDFGQFFDAFALLAQVGPTGRSA